MRDRIYNAIDEAERYADAAFDVLRNSIERALDDAAKAGADQATAQPAHKPTTIEEIVAALSRYYRVEEDVVLDWLPKRVTW